MKRLLGWLFGCAHTHTTFPITPRRQGRAEGNPYVVCLDCGREFDYDWQHMRIIAPRNAGKEAADGRSYSRPRPA